jgi:hypothetical protein
MPMPVSATEISTEPLSGIDADPPAPWRELARVGKQIKQNLFDLALVADDVAQALVNGNVERDAVPGGGLAALTLPQSER